jgi:hypothetical protein
MFPCILPARSPAAAICQRANAMCADFGLAVFFDPEALPRTDLGLEGTPWCALAADA